MFEVNDFGLDLEFPDPSDFEEVAIVPVYVEPLAYSGERLFVGLVVQGKHGVNAFPLESLGRLQSIYGPAHKSLIAARDIALASILSWVRQHGIDHLSQWMPPGEGIFAGKLVHTTTASVQEAVQVSFSEYSSLYREPVFSIQVDSGLRSERTSSLTATQLETTVRDIVAAFKPPLASKFFQKFQVSEGARPMTLGFVGKNLVANFGVIVPQSLSARVSKAKAQLWDLASAREGCNAGWFDVQDNREYSLFVRGANENDTQYTWRQLASVKEALNELEVEADKLKLRCRSVGGPREIAEHLVRSEI